MDSGNYLDHLWTREIQKGVIERSFKVKKTLFAGHSPYQQIDVVETVGHGMMLLLDRIGMLTERDEFIYHEMIAHVPLMVHPAPQRVLVIGGGDGGTVREVLKHDGVEQVVMIEIDEMVVAVCRKHIPSVSSALDDSRLDLRFEDGIAYMANTEERYDVVIVDSTDPVGPGVGLFSRSFYESCARVLNPDGILITQAESPFYDDDIQGTMFKDQRPFFSRLHMYLYQSLTYPGGLWSFGFASKGPCPIEDFKQQRIQDANLNLRYYNANMHRAAFMLPEFIFTKFNGVLDPLNW